MKLDLKFIKGLATLAIIAILLMLFLKRDHGNPIDWAYDWVKPDWHKPNPVFHVTVKPDSLGHAPDPGLPHINVTHGQITPGELDLVISFDSTLYNLAFNTSYHGVGQIYVAPDGTFKLYYPRFGFEPTLLAGYSLRGLSAHLETFYINNFLGVANVHPLTPEVVMPDLGSLDSSLVGIGCDIDIYPQRTNIRLGVSYDWRIVDLKPAGLNAYLAVELFRF